MRLFANVDRKVIHGPDCEEPCKLDDARKHDYIKVVSFSAAALLRYEGGFTTCERFDPPDDRPKDEQGDGDGSTAGV